MERTKEMEKMRENLQKMRERGLTNFTDETLEQLGTVQDCIRDGRVTDAVVASSIRGEALNEREKEELLKDLRRRLEGQRISKRQIEETLNFADWFLNKLLIPTVKK